MLAAVRVQIECTTERGERVVLELEERAPGTGDPLEVVDAAVARVRAGLLATEPRPPAPAKRRRAGAK